MTGLVQVVLGKTQDADARVRLEAVVSAGQLDADQHSEAFQAVLNATTYDIDDNLDFAIWQSLRKLDASFSHGSILTAMHWEQKPEQLAYAVSALGTEQAAEVAVEMLETGKLEGASLDVIVEAIAIAGNPPQLGRTVKALLAMDANNLSMTRLQPLLNRTSRDKAIPTEIGPALESMAGAAIAEGRNIDPEKLDVLARIAGVWQVEQLVPVLVGALDDAESPIRQQLIRSLGAFNTPEVTEKLAQLTRDPDVGTRVAATRAIASRRPLAAIDSVVALLEDEAAADAGAAILVGLLNRKGVPERMAEAIETREFPVDLARSLLRGVRGAGGHPELEQAIRDAGKLENAAWQFTPQLRDEILAAAASQGSPARGEAIYRRAKLQCIECHAIGNAGGLVGPNLISVGGSSQPDYILESLLDPNAKLKEGFTTLTVLTDEGEILNGIVLGRNDQFVRLRLADGKEVQIDAEAIEQEKPGKSLMPEGLLDSLTKPELVDLVAFLSALGRDPAYTVSTDPIVRSLETP
ncbi:MAG: HEAT repeat domain-containing protein, partial [Planctomycetes bacterium]|nr:HEAT repeat domain-containing protein [Planctomycetota bacterium]